MLLGKCSARCIDCMYTYVRDLTICSRAILHRYGVMLSGPIDFVVVVVFKCCYEFSNFVCCNRLNAESVSILKFALAKFFQCG